MLKQVKNKLPRDLRILVYRSLAESHLRYALSIWGPALKDKDKRDIEKMQKRCLRAAQGIPFNGHTDPVFRKHNILKFQDLITFEQAAVIFKSKTDDLPPSLTSLLESKSTRSTRTLEQSGVARTTKDPPLLNSLRSNWNALPTAIRQSKTYGAFTAQFMQWTTATYNTSCTLPSCYTCKEYRDVAASVNRMQEEMDALSTQQRELVQEGKAIPSDFIEA